MAENKLIFPIGFDLEKGVKEAQNDVDGYLGRIAAAVEKHPITVKVQLDQKPGLSTAVRAESQRATRELAGFKKEMAEINRQWNALSARDRGGDMGARLMARYRELTQEAKGYTSTVGAAVKLEDRLAKQRERSANAATNAAQKTREYNNELKSQDGYISRLVKRLAVYAGFSAIRTFLTSVRDVTAEFELQRVSLGAIIQDQNRANQLFSEIKSFALKSPLKILDLTKYVKQVAAYRIETDKLFDTTKRLADVSVGLGVDMGRLVLAYGQVKAASYLRAAEIRQFTEAGIPMLELLAEKFTEIQGKAVSTEQVMDLVSKRAVSFSMVEEIFKDMTDAGGMFYNMQEKQAQTLFGMWSKLGDAAAVMYEQIGNVGWVNEGLKEGIGLLENMMRNWRAISKTAIFTALPSAAIAALYKYSTATQRVEAAQAAASAATERRKAAVLQLAAAIDKGSVDDINAANATLQKAKADEVAAKKGMSRMGLMKSGFTSLAKSFASGLGIGLLITAVTSLIYKFFEAWENARRLKNTLNEIDAERIVLTSQSIRNFEYLANAAVKAADGSKQQNDALAELHRTYKDMIPVQDMTIDKLRAMHGNYTILTDAIREYINEQQKQKALSAVQEEYSGKQQTAMRNLYDWFKDQGLSSNERERFFREFERQAEDSSKTLKEKIVAAFEAAGIEGGEKLAKSISKEQGFWDNVFTGFFSSNIFSAPGYYVYRKIFPDTGYINDLNEAIVGYNENIQAVLASYEDASGELGEFKKVMDDVAKAQADVIYKDKEGTILDDNSYQKQQMQINRNIKDFANKIRNDETFKKAFQKIGVDIQEQWFDIVDKLNENDLGHISSIQFDAIIKAAEGKHPQLEKALKMWQNEYNNMVPSDEGVQVTRAKFVEIANEMGPKFIDRVKSGLRGATESLKDYRKRIEDTVNDLAVSIKSLNAELAMTPVYDLAARLKLEAKLKDTEELKAHYDKILAILPDFSKTSGNGGGDNRLQNLKEIEQTLTAINTKYEELVKKEGKTAALDYVKKNYASTLEYVNKLGKKFGLKFEMPTDFKDLQTYRKNIQKVIETLKMKGYEKAAIELELKVAEGNQDKLEKQIEKQLKELADRISRTKMAKEFYDNVLRMTGDYELAATFSMSVYGNTGERLKADIVKQIESAFKSGDKTEIDLSSAINYNTKQVDYAKLRRIYDQYQNHLIAQNKETARKLIEDGEKASADQILLWLKDLEKAKTFAEKRVELARYTANQIAAIETSNLPQTQKETMTEQYKIRENKETAKLEYEAFKNSPMYTAMFEKLDAASTAMLKNMQKRLIALKSEWKNLDPTQIKELQSRLDEVNDQLTIKNPYRTLIQSFKEWKTLREQGLRKDAEQELINKTKELERAEALQVQRIEQAEAAQQAYNAAVAEYGMGSQQANQAKLQLTFAKQQERRQTKIVDTTRESVNESEKLVNSWKALGQQTGGAFAQMDAINQAIVGLANDLKDAFGGFGSDADAQYFDDMVSSFSNLSSGISNIAQGVMSGNPVAIIQGVGSAISGIVGLFTAGKVRRANKEIEKQQEILDQLEYSYERLEKAAEKSFGGDYIRNFKDQQANLQAQIAATQKQLAAEQSKGKKTDDDKVKEYKEQIRALKDELADMQGPLAEQFLGTDLTSAARDFAKAWLDAYKEFSNTTDAMSEKFQEMVENMVVEGAMAAVMERALKPMFDMIDNMDDDDFYSEDFWREVSEKAAQGAKDADAGASILMNFLEKAGISMRDLGGDLTGISRDIASASEESVNGLAATMNTWGYYVSYVPQIAENVAALRAILEGGSAPIQSGQGVTDLVTLQNQSLTHLQAINQHTAETVTECRRIAERCTTMAEDIHRVVVPKGTKGNYAIQAQVS